MPTGYDQQIWRYSVGFHVFRAALRANFCVRSLWPALGIFESRGKPALVDWKAQTLLFKKYAREIGFL
jgi:hypothetical protein